MAIPEGVLSGLSRLTTEERAGRPPEIFYFYGIAALQISDLPGWSIL
jgi:hypothetical protein